MRASALVFEGEGFSASTVRGVATGLALLVRTSFPHKIFANIEAASAFLEREQPEAPTRFSAAELAAARCELQAAVHR